MILPAAMPVWGDVTDLDRWFRVSRTEAFALVAAGKITSEKSGKRRRILMSSVNEHLLRMAEGEREVKSEKLSVKSLKP